MWNLKYGTNEPFYKTETDSQTQRTDLWLPTGGEREWDGQGVWGWQMQTVTFERDKQWSSTMCDWVTILYSRNSHNTINQLYFNKN